jgi:hypothetical protein
MGVSLELKEGVGQHPSVVIHQKSTVGQPRRGATPGAEEGGLITGFGDALNVSAMEDGFCGGVELACMGLQFQCATGPTPA